MQVAQDIAGVRHYNMSLCRIAVQVYHASPLPLVRRDSLQEDPLENGYRRPDNLRSDLFAVMTKRQWQSTMIHLMAKQFMYALVMPDIVEAARRLGNLLHTLSDSFAAGHVVRKSRSGAAPSAETCRSLVVKTPISMDVVNWLRHVPADEAEDVLWKCSSFYETAAIEIWADTRAAARVTTADAVNEAIDQFVQRLLCRVFHVHPNDLDKPAGGAPAYFSSDSIRGTGTGKPVMPRGVATERDANRIIGDWTRGLMAYRQNLDEAGQQRVPESITILPRGIDLCMSPQSLDIVHVKDEDIHQVLTGKVAPTYLMMPPVDQSVVLI